MLRHPRRTALFAAFALVVGLTAAGGSALADTAPATPPVLTSIQASTNGDVGLGQTVTETFTTPPGRPVANERIAFYDASGKKHLAVEKDTTGTVPVTIDKTWTPGPVRVYWALVMDDYRVANDWDQAMYYGDGHYTSDPATTQTTTDLDFTPALFTVAYPNANLTAPLVTSIHASSVSVGDGQTVTENLGIVDSGTVTGFFDVVDSAGHTHSTALDSPFLIDSSWPEGSVRVASVFVHDDSGNQSTYSADGSLATVPASASTTQDVDFSGGDFVVASHDLTKETEPVITGTATVGGVLTVHTGIWNPSVQFSYQWLANGQALSVPSGPSLTVPASAWGQRISIVVTGSHPGDRPVSLTSAVTHTVARPMVAAPLPVIKGTRRVGATLTSITGSWAPAPVAVAYQWFADGVAVPHATHPTLRLTAAQTDKSMTLRVTGTRTGYAITVRMSYATPPIARQR